MNPNRVKPRHADAYRTRALTPVLTISDDGGGYYFKRPFLIAIGPDESLYVADENQLLGFDAQGRFVRNYFRRGQGPGELSRVSGFAAIGGMLVVHNMYPSKIVRFGLDGKILADFPVPASGRSYRFRGASGRTGCLIGWGMPDLQTVQGSEAILDQPNPIAAVDLEGGGLKTWSSFPTRVFVQKAEKGGGAMIPMGKIYTAMDGKYLAVSHTDEYAIKILDLETGSLIRTITRDYARVKISPEDRRAMEGGPMIGNKVVQPPIPKFAADITGLFFHGHEIWAATSTRVAGKGALIDVFSLDGTYLDCFYLQLPAPPDRNVEQPDPQVIQGDILASIERSADDAYVVRKYRIGK
ncbi:MAG: 6-bladed beta-propeller [Candidatus Aminicenantes bacterium]|nr:6-bladed beta-propeller [Candidatus Aminicenantes bacterium]